jgi:RimJ/RimL family protein N-acetyltransferase|tara:strand:+ start:12031 stop:12441 length:411 start_codon:yes stop_codon:yes gene_type:complete
MEDLELKSVTKTDVRFLYNQLKERDPKINISHKRMPSYSEHTRFVLSKPYSKWYIIYYKNRKVGNVYLSKMNEIGIFILKTIKVKGLGSLVLEQVLKKNPKTRYLANVNPKNIKSAEFFKKNGFKLIQHTYELTFD